MAIKPLEQRLETILPDVAPAPADLPEPIFPEDNSSITEAAGEPGAPAMDDNVQLAGLTGVGARLRGVIKQKTEDAAAALKAKPEATQRPIVTNEVGPDGLPKVKSVTTTTITDEAGGTVVEKSKTRIIPEAPQDTVDKVGAAIENRVATGKLDGKPPEEAFNLTNMQNDNVAAIIGGVGDALGIQTKKVTFEEIKQKATDLGVDEVFLNRLLDSNGKMLPSAVDTYRAFQVLESSADELGRLFSLVNSGQASEAQMLQLRQQITFHGLVQKAVKGVQTETARALAVMRIPREGSVDVIRQTLDQTGGAASLQDLARAYMTLDNAADRNKLVEKSMMSTAKDVWFTTYINGLLSLPTTHAKNIIGNTLFGAYQIPERMIASFYSNVLPDGVRSWRALVPGSAKEKVEFDEVLTELQSLRLSVSEGLTLARRSWSQNAPTDPMSKLELKRTGDQPDISAAALGMEPDTWLAKGVDLYGKVITLPGRALMTEDEFFKGWFYRTAFNRLALRRSKSVYRDAIEGGADEATAAARAETELDSIYKNPPADLDEQAMNYARKGTFTMDLPPALKNLEGSFQHPIAKMIVPFFRTPANIALEVIERTPFAPISSRFRDDLAKGGPDRDLALAKVTMGSALLATFAGFSGEGYLTGRGPARKADREALMRGGWQPYSLVLPKDMFGDQIERLNSIGRVSISDDKIYVSFNGMEPISAFLAMAADYAEYARYEDDAGKTEEVFMGALYGMYHYMSEQPWLTGIADIASALGGTLPNANKTVVDVVNAIVKQGTSFGIGGSPAGAYNSAVAGIERFMAPEASDTSVKGQDLPMGVKGFYEGLKRYMARVPGLSNSLPERLNLWGDTIIQGQGSALEMVLPTRVSPGQFSPTDDVLVRLGSPIGMPARKVEGVELNADQYNRLLTIYGKQLNAKQILFEVATAPGFGEASLDVQQTLIKKKHEDLMGKARELLVAEDPDIRARMAEQRAKRNAFGLFYKDR